MSVVKQTLSEDAAARLFFQRVIDGAIRVWPTLESNLFEVSDRRFQIADVKKATYDLMLAAVALDLQAVANLFSRNQACRIENLIYVVAGEPGSYARSEIHRYSREFRKELQTVEVGGNPVDIISALLLHRWLGIRLQEFAVAGTDIVDPLLVGTVTRALFAPPIGGTWNAIAQKYDLTPGNIPVPDDDDFRRAAQAIVERRKEAPNASVGTKATSQTAQVIVERTPNTSVDEKPTNRTISQAQKRTLSFKTALPIVAGLLLLGTQIDTIDSMPGYGAVYLDDNSKSYIAIACEAQWRDRSVQSLTVYRLATLRDAEVLGYKMDPDCRDAGGFSEDGPSLTSIVLIKLGLLPPSRHRWDATFRTEQGVVYPGKATN